jgi:hypothetical protein
MHRTVSSIVAMSLALHMLLGCCWHHAHAEAVECAEVGHDHAHGESLPGDHDEPLPSDHDDAEPCEGEGCVFVKCEQTLTQMVVPPVSMAAIFSDTRPTLSLGVSTSVLPSLLFPVGNSTHFMCAMLRC